ncbi:MAG: MBL fold metallo-hydrolase, partial [Patescibacteria group bacterium]
MNLKEHITKNIKRYVLGILFLTAGFVWYVVFIETTRDKLTIAFLNIGQGDSIFIEAPNGNQILIDGGPGASVLRELGKIMPFYDRSINVVLATHPDKDHIGGLVDVLDRFAVFYFVEPGVLGTTGIFSALENSVADHNIKKIIARRGGSIDLGNGAVLDILFPDHDVSRVKNTNDGSIVARLSYGETSVMLTGDAP